MHWRLNYCPRQCQIVIPQLTQSQSRCARTRATAHSLAPMGAPLWTNSATMLCYGVYCVWAHTTDPTYGGHAPAITHVTLNTGERRANVFMDMGIYFMNMKFAEPLAHVVFTLFDLKILHSNLYFFIHASIASTEILFHYFYLRSEALYRHLDVYFYWRRTPHFVLQSFCRYIATWFVQPSFFMHFNYLSFA